MKRVVFSLFITLFTLQLFAQGISINTDNSNPDVSAILDVKSTTQGMLVPRLTTAQRNAVASPATGLLVFDTDMGAFYFYNGANWINLSTGNLISGGAGSVYLTDTTTNFGVGTTMPNGKMVVVADSLASPTDPVFEVRNKTGQTIFAVYNEGVRIYVDATSAKPAEKGGFAVGGYIPNKGILPYEFLRVTQDSVRVYIDENTSVIKPAEKGGFAVGGFNSGAKASGYSPYEFLRVTQDSVRVYINESTARPAEKGGFAVGGYNPGKKALTDNNFLTITPDSSRIYVKDSLSGFSIINKNSGETGDFFNINRHNCFVGYKSGENIKLGMYGDSSQTSWLGAFNTFVGYKTGFNTTTGRFNVFMGYMAGLENNGPVSLTNPKNNGSFNTFIGYQSGKNNSTGGSNTFLGYESGLDNTSGDYNTFLGRSAGSRNQTGHYNVFIGHEAGKYESTNSSYKLHINASATSSPSGPSLIYGEFDNDFLQFNGTTYIRDSAWVQSGLKVSKGLYIEPSLTLPSKSMNGVLYVDQASQDLMYYSNGAYKAVNIKDVIKLEPRLTAPVSPTEGTIYYNKTAKTIQYFDGTQWKTLGTL